MCDNTHRQGRTGPLVHPLSEPLGVAEPAVGAVIELAHTQLDYARLLGRQHRARQLLDAAARAAEELELPLVAQRAAALSRG